VTSGLEQEILDEMASAAGLDAGSIDIETNLHDLGIDSLSALEILVILEDTFGVRVPEESLRDTSNVSEIVSAFVVEIRNSDKEASP
jgi:acyl carrier protein